MDRLICQVVIDGVKTIDEVANRALDDFSYHGKTIREWADSISNPKTKGDLLRSMSDEELAEFICKTIRDGVSLVFPMAQYSKDDIAELTNDWLSYLKSPVEVEE